MIKSNRNLFLVVALSSGLIGLAGCGATSTNTVVTGNAAMVNTATINTATINTGNSGNVAVIVNQPANAMVENVNIKPANAPIGNANLKPANATVDMRKPLKTIETVSADTSANEKIGVPECDEYIAKYEACVNGKVPADQRADLLSPIEAMRKGWRTAATNPPAKAALAGGCKVALATAKQSLSKYSCDW